MSNVRTRFAPSPTGFVHVGSLRTALYDYLLAKKLNGTFVLRIEDTDQTREVQGAVENLINVLQKTGIDFDEGPIKGGPYGPYVQSERLDIYNQYAQQLIQAGHAYYCTCSQERLEQLRQRQIAAKLPPAYDRHCRNLNLQPQPGEPHVIRMKVPMEGDITFNDAIHGNITFNYRNVDDQVLIKSDGFPTYHLAVVVDDHLMKISHVIRGEEWISSTPKHILLYQYFGWEMPIFAHLPLILNPDRSKLSKRQGDVAVEDYLAKGFLPEALVNFVALLGWNPGDTREVFSMDELIKEFTLERCGKSGAIFDTKKLLWMNEQHIRLKSDKELLEILKPIMAERNLKDFKDGYLLAIIALMKERVTFVKDFIDNCPYFYQDPTTFDEAARAKNWTPETAPRLRAFAERCAGMQTFDSAEIEKEIRSEADKQQISASRIIHPLRLAVSGVSVGASLFHLVELLGKDTVIRRINFAIEKLG
jgi:glutamyl-tRNA synthetase, bacterial family